MIQIKKMYTAFVSSVFNSLKKQRGEVISALLDNRVFPICMEHFTVSTDSNFDDIKSLIDESDLFILLLGTKYGSTDKDGVSITEREYEYAKSKKMKMVTIITEELGKHLNMTDEERAKLSEDEQKQIRFASSIDYAKQVSRSVPISTILSQFLGNFNLDDDCIGWVRAKQTESNLFQEKYKGLDIGGRWYHIHVSPDDEKYIRTGHIDIKQNFTESEYSKLFIEGFNFSIKYNKDTQKFKEQILKNTHWKGDYTLDLNGNIQGIFNAQREYSDKFGEVKIDRGAVRGIHDFFVDPDEETTEFFGNFHDVAPSPKIGKILFFRSKEERDAYVYENLDVALEANS